MQKHRNAEDGFEVFFCDSESRSSFHGPEAAQEEDNQCSVSPDRKGFVST